MNFAQSTIFNITASFGLMIINMAIGIITARILGPEELGRFNIFLTSQTLFITIFALGVGQSCIYFINSLKVDKSVILTTTIKAMVPYATTASILFFFILLIFRNYFGYISTTFLLLFVIGTNSLLIITIFVPVLLADMQVIKNQIVKYIARIITLATILFIIFINTKLDVGLLISISGITNLISLILLHHYLKNSFSLRSKVDKALLKKLLKWGLKLSGNNIASVLLTSLPIYFLSWFSFSGKYANVGYYTRATSLLVIGTVIASSIGPLLYSRWSLLKTTELRNHVKKISMPFFIVNLLITSACFVFATIIIKLLYGSDFLPAVPVLRILSLTLIFNGMKEICYGILSSQGVPLRILKNLSISIVLLVCTLIMIIPKYGLVGCAWGTLIITAISTFLLMFDVANISSIKMSDFFVFPSKKEYKSIIASIKSKRNVYK